MEMISDAKERYGIEDPVSGGPRLSEYDAVVERLDLLIDAMHSATGAIVASAGGRPPTFKPMPRPDTAAERVAHRRRSAKSQALAARLLGRTDR